MQKKVTLSVNEEVYREFQKYCEENAILLSKKVENVMQDIMKGEAGKEKSIHEIRKTAEKSIEKVRTWIG